MVTVAIVVLSASMMRREESQVSSAGSLPSRHKAEKGRAQTQERYAVENIYFSRHPRNYSNNLVFAWVLMTGSISVEASNQSITWLTELLPV
jgi:hypothetical protein